MAVYIYRFTDGTLVSSTLLDTDPVASDAILSANGFGRVSGLAPIDATHTWDPPTRSIIVVAAPNAVISTAAFINAFTATEWAGIKGSADTTIKQFLDAMFVSSVMDLSAARITQALTYLVTKGLLTAPRAQAIAATVS